MRVYVSAVATHHCLNEVPGSIPNFCIDLAVIQPRNLWVSQYIEWPDRVSHETGADCLRQRAVLLHRRVQFSQKQNIRHLTVTHIHTLNIHAVLTMHLNQVLFQITMFAALNESLYVLVCARMFSASHDFLYKLIQGIVPRLTCHIISYKKSCLV